MTEPGNPPKQQLRLFNDEDLETLKELLLERFPDPPCEFCGHKEWYIGGHLCSMPAIEIMEDGSLQQSATGGVVAIPIVCTNCGNHKFLHPRFLGFKPEIFGPQK